MAADTQKESMMEALCNRRMLICIGIGFTSGLPLYILISLVPAWLRTEGVSLADIGLFALIGFPYTWKFLWSPFMDRYTPLAMGRRRSWMLITQLLLLVAVASMGMVTPQQNLGTIATICALVAFFSASQDIVLDAYRRELLPDAELGLGNSIHVNAYRIAGLIPGSLSLILADHMSWSQVFHITALFMLVGIITTLLIKEPKSVAQPRNLRDAVVTPFQEFISRQGIKQALLILGFMFLYKLGDNMATALSTPFYLDMGFSKTEIGLVAKHAGLWPMVIGGLLGGLVMVRLGINRSLWLFGAVQMISILGFYVLSVAPEPNLWLLALVISFEYLGVGLGTAAFVAFIARTTSKAHTATQMALFTALTALPRTFANATTGFIIDTTGWSEFFIICTLLAIPGMLLLLKVAPWNGADDETDDPDSDTPEEDSIEAEPARR